MRGSRVRRGEGGRREKTMWEDGDERKVGGKEREG